jgi:hypothetical protein
VLGTPLIISWLAALVPAAGLGTPAPAVVAVPTPAAYSQAVGKICAGALLFEGRYATGTRKGALAVARDIRASTGRRLARVAALPPPLGQQRTVVRWIALEERLAEAYARNYLRIYDAISAPGTSAQHARNIGVAAGLVHEPDPIRSAAAVLERQLRVPGCTGG